MAFLKRQTCHKRQKQSTMLHSNLARDHDEDFRWEGLRVRQAEQFLSSDVTMWYKKWTWESWLAESNLPGQFAINTYIGMGMFDHRAQKTIFRHSIFYFLAFLLVAWLLSNAAPAQVRNYSSNKYLFIDSTVDPDLVSRRIVLVYFSQFMMVIGSLTIHKLE